MNVIIKAGRSAASVKEMNFQKSVFRNGLTLISERHSEFKSLSIGIWVKAGTRNEKPREAGISHFLEHMLFKGTENRSSLEIAREIDRVGGEFNAFTAREYTCFHLLLLSRDLALGLEILSDVILNSSFDAAELERERKVILQEIMMVEESHEELVHDVYFELIYGRHGLGRPILGTEASTKRMRRMDLLRYFRKHYSPEQLIVSVAGNVSHSEIKRKLKALLKRLWPGRPVRRETRRELGYESAPALRPGTWWMVRGSEQVHIVWGVPGVHYSSRDRLPALLLNAYLGGGMSSSLFQEIREKNGLAYTVYSSLSPFRDSGVFTIYAATGMNSVPLCLKLIEECVAKLRKEYLSEAELEATKDTLKGAILLSSDSAESRMLSIAKNELYMGRYVGVADICKLIDQVTPEDVRRVARKFLRGGNRSILFLGPRPSRLVRNKLKPQMISR